MGVYKRGNVFWICYARADGRIIKQTSHSKSKQEALAFLHQVKSLVTQQKQQKALLKLSGHEHASFLGHPLVPSSQGRKSLPHGSEPFSVSDLMDMWMKYHESNDRGRPDEVKSRFQTIVDFFGKDKQVISLTSEEIDELKNNLKNRLTRYKKEKWKPATVNRHLALLKAAINLFIDRKKLNINNPFSSVKLFKENNKRDRIITHDEEEKIKLKLDLEPKIAFIIAMNTGWRLNEILNFRIENSHIILDPKYSKNGEGRKIPLNNEMQALFEAHRNFKFTFNGDKIGKEFRKVVRELKIKNLTFHDSRHTVATRLRRAGVDIIMIKKMLGHKSMSMVERYQTIDADDFVDAVSKL